MDKIILTTRLNIQDYIKLNYHLFYRLLGFKLMTAMGVFMLISMLVNYDSLALTDFPWIPLGFALFFTICFPTLIYFTAKKNFQTNRMISETIRYEFDRNSIQIIGESFNSKMTWDKIYKVTESNDWILIWQNRQITTAIPKRDFKNGDLKLFKEIVNSQKSLKNELKRPQH